MYSVLLGRPSAAGGRLTLPAAWTPFPMTAADALSARAAFSPTSRPAISARLIDGNTPEKLGIASALWTRRAVGELIHKELGIELAERTVGEYLRRWNYTPKKPQRHARKQDPDEVQQWLALTYPAIEKQAAEEDAEIHWCDETGVAGGPSPRHGLFPERPTGDDGGACTTHSHEPDFDGHQRGNGPVHDLQGSHEHGLVPGVPGATAAQQPPRRSS